MGLARWLAGPLKENRPRARAAWPILGPTKGLKIGPNLGQKFSPWARQMGNTKIKTLLTLSKIREINMKVIKVKVKYAKNNDKRRQQN